MRIHRNELVRHASRVAVAIAIAIAIGSAPAAAATDALSQTAKTLYQSGLTDYNLGHYESALAAFDQAYRVRRDPAFLFNIGQCQRQLHRYEDAQRSYRAYLRESTELSADAREQAQKLVAEMQRAIEEERSRSSVVPSIHTQARAVAPAPIRAVSPSDRAAGRQKLVAGTVVAAFGVLAIAAGGAFHAVAQSANESLNDPSNRTFSASAEDRRDTFQSLDIAAFVVGGVAVATGGTLALIGWRQRHRVTLTPNASATRIGATIDVRF